MERIKNYFVSKGQTLGVAESLTGGSICQEVVTIPGASQFFKGGLVSYQTEVKEKNLRIPKNEIRKHGVVSLEVAQLMAQGVKELLNCDWAVSATGYAGPTGGDEKNPVGTVCFAVVGPDFAKTERKIFSKKERNEVQQLAVTYILEFLEKCLYTGEREK